MTFIFNTADNSEAIQKFIKYGRGGAGGGVEHRCWAGRFEVEFEGKIMLDTSVFPSKEAAAAAGATQAIAELVINHLKYKKASFIGGLFYYDTSSSFA